MANLEDRNFSADQMDLDEALAKVRKLIERANYFQEHGDEDQYTSAMTQADALMFKYAIDRAKANEKLASPAQAKPKSIKVWMCKGGDPLAFEISCLVRVVTEHCRCEGVWLKSNWRDQETEIFGYESDVRYAEMLYTQLLTHMTSVLFPKMDPSKTLGHNCYILHNQGLNWLDMGELDGWKKEDPKFYPNIKVPFRSLKTGEVVPSTKVGGIYKRAYLKEVARLNEKPKIVPASASRQARTDAFRKSVAAGYVSRIAQRLAQIRKANRGSGMELVLARQMDRIQEMVQGSYPDLSTSVDTYQAKLNLDAWAKGSRRADEADLGVGVGGKSPVAIS